MVDFSDFKKLALSIIALLIGFGILGIIVSVILNPDMLVKEGGSCRATLLGVNRLAEITEHSVKINPDCKIMEREILMKKDYFSGIKVKNLGSDRYKDAVERDFVELVAKSWWITGEGDITDSQIEEWIRMIGSSNKCLVVYAAKMKPAKGVEDSIYNFEITKADIDLAMGEYTRAEIFGKNASSQTIQEYVGAQGYHTGGAVFIVEQDKDNSQKYHASKITQYIPGTKTPQIYGVAVGFDQVSALSAKWDKFWGEGTTSINDKSRYILIAPFDQIKNYCAVQNE